MREREILARVRAERPELYFKALVKLTLALHRAIGEPTDFDRRRNREEVLRRLEARIADARTHRIQNVLWKSGRRRECSRAVWTPMRCSTRSASSVLYLPRLFAYHCVILLSAVHGLFARWVKAFAADRNQHSQKFYRIINEVPTIAMIDPPTIFSTRKRAPFNARQTPAISVIDI